MAITAENIRALSGLSAAELPSEVIAASLVLDRIELDRDQYFVTPIDINEATTAEEKIEAFKQHDYRVWKAITYLEQYIRASVPKTITDNFNSFTRFNDLESLIGYAKAFTATVEQGSDLPIESIFFVVSPETDPVTEG